MPEFQVDIILFRDGDIVVLSLFLVKHLIPVGAGGDRGAQGGVGGDRGGVRCRKGQESVGEYRGGQGGVGGDMGVQKSVGGCREV